MDNPLLDFSGLSRFSAARPERVGPAVEALVAEGRATIERLAADPSTPTWENFVDPLDDANERLARAWAQVSHLNFADDKVCTTMGITRQPLHCRSCGWSR